MQQTRHTCPRNCFSTCSMLSYTDGGRLMKVTGDPAHPYTRGRLCAKGLSYVNQVYHPDRLTHPLFQRVKGNGRFERISWEEAYEMIIQNWLGIDRRHGSLLPVALYKYTGDLSVGHYAPEEFFSSVGPTTRIVGSPCAAAGFDAAFYDFGGAWSSDPEDMRHARLIVIWGANPAVTSIHSIHYLQEARQNGATVVVIDPVMTKTAKLADVYVQINPGTDGLLANALAGELIRQNRHDSDFVKGHTEGFDAFSKAVTPLTFDDVSVVTGISMEALTVLHELILSSDRTFHWIGLGFQRHTNGGQMVRAVNALAAVDGMIGKQGAGVHYGHSDTWIFTNQTAFFTEHLNRTNRILPLNDWIELGDSHLDTPIESMWISCRNPLIQDPQPAMIREHLKEIPFVITSDLFMTETARWSNLVLPATTFFEEEDIATSYWHRGFQYNMQAINPVGEAKSDYTMMKDLAARVDGRFHHPSTFPINLSKRDYLNRQWNDQVIRQFGFQNVHEAIGQIQYPKEPLTSWTDLTFQTPSGRFEFDSRQAVANGLPGLPVHTLHIEDQEEGLPLRLLTPHDTAGLNSQFQSATVIPKREPLVYLHPNEAGKRGISTGDQVDIFNRNARMTMKVFVTPEVAKNTVLIYQGSGTTVETAVNQLVSVKDADMGDHASGSKGIAYYDTFVEVTRT